MMEFVQLDKPAFQCGRWVDVLHFLVCLRRLHCMSQFIFSYLIGFEHHVAGFYITSASVKELERERMEAHKRGYECHEPTS